VVVGHQLGAASAALLAGYMRNSLGSYTASSIMMGIACMVAAVMVLRIHGGKQGSDDAMRTAAVG